ncbi:MAG: glutamate--cysteine ligase, partial [Inhella sp.]
LLAAYLQALCALLLDGGEPPPAEDDYLVYTYNRFQACRFGLHGTLVHPKSYEQISIREDVLRTLRRLQPYAEQLESVEALEGVHELVYRGSGAHWLREERARVGSVEGVVDAAIRRFAGTL